MSAHELTDRSVSIDSLVRPAFGPTLSRFETGAPSDAVMRLGELVADLAGESRPVDSRVRLLTTPDAYPGRVRDAARHLGIGDRALRAWSAAHLGMGLRRFMTIRRLHRALEYRIQHPHTTWSRIAAATGFADHSHLVRDCRALLGESPGEFLTRAG